MRKLAALLLFIVLSSAAYLGIQHFVPEEQPTAQTPLEQLVAKDLRYLADNNFLGFKKEDLKDVQVLLDSQTKGQKELQGVVNLLYAEFQKHKNGKQALEISLIGGADPNAPKAKKKILVLQMSLTDHKSQNKVWELGRSYTY